MKYSKEEQETDLLEIRPVDGRILDILVDNHAEFTRFLGKRVGSQTIAEDLLQQGLLRAVQHQDQLRENGNVVAWFYTVLRNILIDHYRAQAVDSRKNDGFFAELLAVGGTQSYMETELGEAVCACMKRLIPTLRPQYAEVIERLDLQGQPLDEVARLLKISTGNLTVRLHRARQALRRSLEQSCGTCTQHGCLDCTCKQL